jgi:hypothetical protein
MKKRLMKKMPFSVRNLVWFCMPLSLLFMLSCSDSGTTDTTDKSLFNIDIPSAYESVLAEMRDFYVIGYFGADNANGNLTYVDYPGDIKIELYRGGAATGTPIRTVQSNVDPTTLITPTSVMNYDYSEGHNWPDRTTGETLKIIPDIVTEPGGFDTPQNKCVVSNRYYAGLFLGGVTRDFDTTYTDVSGNPLEDLTAGTYTIKVTGLSGKLNGFTETKTITLGLTHASLGRYSPASTRDKLTSYSRERGYRLYFDPFPGYFFIGGMTYEIKNRWMPNNSIEVVNVMPDTLVDNAQSAQNDILLYNVNEGCATHKVEIGAIVANDLVESERTTFHYYNIGEPVIHYVTMASQNATLEGNFADFAISDYLVLPRVEIQTNNGELADNDWYFDDTSPKSLDLNVADGISMTANDVFILYGVVKPIPSTVNNGEHHFEYEIDDQISRIKYTITAPDVSQTTTTRDVGLDRHYTASWKANSIYEFMHVFTVDSGTGTYTMKMVGINSYGEDVPGTAENFQINVK